MKCCDLSVLIKWLLLALTCVIASAALAKDAPGGGGGAAPTTPSDAIYDITSLTFQSSDVCTIYKSLTKAQVPIAGAASVDDLLKQTVTRIASNQPLLNWSTSMLADAIQRQCPACAVATSGTSGKEKSDIAYIFRMGTWDAQLQAKAGTTKPVSSEWHVYKLDGKDTLKFSGLDSTGEPRIYNKKRILLVGLDRFKDGESGTVLSVYNSTVTQGTPQNQTDLIALLSALAGISGGTPAKSAVGTDSVQCQPAQVFLASGLQEGTKHLPFDDKVTVTADGDYAKKVASTGDISAVAQNGSCATAKSCVYFRVPDNTDVIFVRIKGTFRGILSFEGSADGVNFDPANALPLLGATPVTNTLTPGAWQIVATGLSTVRVKASAMSSGSANVSLQPAADSSATAQSPASSSQKTGQSSSTSPGIMSCTGTQNGLPCTTTRTFTSTDLEWWDVSVGVTIPGVRESNFAITNSVLQKSVTTHTDLYGMLDLYPFAHVADKNDWAPHFNLGVPLSSKSLYRPFFGAAEPISGLLTSVLGLKKQPAIPLSISVFGGMVWMKTHIVGGSPTTSAELASDLVSTRVWKPAYGIEVSVSSMASKIKGAGSKNSNGSKGSSSGSGGS
jgi:hypothetical protein